jgi:predicted ribosomally synthesized peptide with SipW-like signal peptide
MSNMFLNIVSTFKGDGIKQATGELGAFSGKMGGLGSILGKTATALAAFGVTAKAISFGRESIEAARDLERNLFGVEKVFGGLAPQMQQFSKDAVEMGLSQSKAAKASTFIGSVLKQSGFAMGDVAVETQKLISLAQDLSTLYGYDVQEALLGMTALFRGEYDPIEKFGVAMKQSEINSELAARGLNNLEGAARRNAEQTIRLELLYQRAADAVGTFAEQEGTLYVEQKKLGATFENFQATLGAAVIPAVAELNTLFRELLEDITPGMESAFGFLAEVLTGVVGFFQEAMDPTTEFGESVSALIIQFESLFTTIFGKDFSIADFFEGITGVIWILTDALHDVLMIIENTIIGFQVMGESIGLFFTDMEAFLAFDPAGEIRKRIDLKDTINANKLAVQQYIAEWDKARELELSGHISEIGMTADAWVRAKTAANNYARSLAGSADSIERQLMRLANPPKSSAPSSVSSGSGTSAASSKQEQALREMIAAQEQAARELAAAQEAARRAEEERLQKRADAYKSFADSVKSTFGGIKESILSSFSLPDLGNSVNSITRNIKKLLQQTKDFARNITSLSQQGLTNDLLQQVIAAGPIGGGRLAQALAGAGGGFIGELNQAYGEFGGIASGIAGVGTTAAFANREVVNNYYKIEVSGGVGSGPTIGKAIVDAIKSYERTSGAVWQGA